MTDMTVKDLIEKLQKLPPDATISFHDYNNYSYPEVCWDISWDEYKTGYTDQPYIYLTKIEEV